MALQYVWLGDRLTKKMVANASAAFKDFTKEVQQVAMDNCPVDTGALKRSISTLDVSSTQMMGFRIVVGMRYAQYVEWGTNYMRPQPFVRPALDYARDNMTSYIAVKGFPAGWASDIGAGFRTTRK